MLDRCSLEDGMRRQLTIAVLLGIAPIICFAQQSSHKLSDYAGTWQANFEGTQFLTVKLVEKEVLGQFQIDPLPKKTII